MDKTLEIVKRKYDEIRERAENEAKNLILNKRPFFTDAFRMSAQDFIVCDANCTLLAEIIKKAESKERVFSLEKYFDCERREIGFERAIEETTKCNWATQCNGLTASDINDRDFTTWELENWFEEAKQ